ncbi:type II toxin-antitoxin system HicB family antitoxin [Bombilactobacillus folatiphilus]|uniref:Type II toxin-antitoxin system HicB family antitoxin n=1 Tax=Bombilactobacillus folatiphilus TaxID=2923362 RepID=A0ABY4P7E0_9LACO|nr:type II toxin-antitoxin system HicB family antitoxin [Bombilactobacillus folatiphilus]UQS81567.1 type II toxin-antitoxin system HicB family antitoxin [Bombilactobacillus folatiphilus]
MKKVVVYPVILHPEDVGYTVEIPDIQGGWTQGESMSDALTMAQDLIGLALEDDTEYPKATPLEDVQIGDKDIKTIVNVDMDEYHRQNPKTVRKNVSVPEYLVKLGKEKEINFSAVLTEALKAKLEV